MINIGNYAELIGVDKIRIVPAGNTFVPESGAIDSGAVVMDEGGLLIVYYKNNSIESIFKMEEFLC